MAEWKLKSVASGAHDNLGTFSIADSGTNFSFGIDPYWVDNIYTWRLNGHEVYDDDISNDESYINYALGYTGTPTAPKHNKAVGYQYINFLYPWETKAPSTNDLGSSRPTSINEKTFSFYHGIKNTLYAVVYYDTNEFVVDSGTAKLVDNTFNGRSPSFNISGSYLTITMSEQTPSLIEERVGTEIACSSKVYSIPWSVGVRSFRLKNNIPDPNIKLDSDDRAILTFNGITLYNDYISITMSQLAAPANLSVRGNVLSWGASENADSYSIYVDDVYKTTVSGTSWTIPQDIYKDQKHDYSIRANRKITSSFKDTTVSGKQTPGGAESSFSACY